MRLAAVALGLALGCSGCALIPFPWAVAHERINLADTAQMQHDYTRAEDLSHRALTMSVRLYGPDSPELAKPYLQLAGHALRRRDFAEARELTLRAAGLYEGTTKPFKGWDPKYLVADCHLFLSGVLHVEGNVEAAIDEHRTANKICASIVGESDRHRCIDSQERSLAALYRYEGRYEEAEPLVLSRYRDATGAGAESLSPDRLLNLTDFYREYGEYGKALRYYGDGLRHWLAERARRPASRAEPGSVLFGGTVSIGSPPQIHRFFTIAPPGVEFHADVLERSGLAREAFLLSDYERSLWKTETHALNDSLAALGHAHRDNVSASWLRNRYLTLGYVHAKHGDLVAAARYSREALAQMEAEWQKMDWLDRYGSTGDYVEALVRNAALHERLDAPDAALPLYQRAAALADEYFNRRHVLRLDTLAALGRVHGALGRYEDGDRAFERYLALAEQARGREHGDTAWGLAAWADLRARAGDAAAAAKLSERAQAIWRRYRASLPEPPLPPLPVARRM